MKKIELAIRNIDWQIEDAEKAMKEMQERIKNRIEDDQMEIAADSIVSYAMRMQEAAKKLIGLREQRKMLEYIADDED